MKNTPWVAGTLMTAAIATGCLGSQEDRHVDDTDHDRLQPKSNEDEYPLVRIARDATIKGAVGPVVLDHQALPSVYDDGWYLSVESVVELEDRAAMTLLAVSNGSEILVPGLSDTFTIDDYDPDAPSITMLGCVGQEAGVYDEYDLPADEVDVEVEQGAAENEMAVHVTARWFDRADGVRIDTYQQAETEFTLLR
jgi:hypothetical protein